MQTPKEYTTNLNDRIITSAMLVDCIYSSNKRAKNYRDKEREYRAYYRENYHIYDKYNNVGKMKSKKEEYYKQKEIMLSILKPICIHKEFYGYEKRRIYDYEKDYEKYNKKKAFVWENCYWDERRGGEIWFGDIELKNKPLYHYYLFYDINAEHTFHTPITIDDIANYELSIIEIDKLDTHGRDPEELISNQFVKKVIELIQSGNYKYITDDN